MRPVVLALLAILACTTRAATTSTPAPSVGERDVARPQAAPAVAPEPAAAPEPERAFESVEERARIHEILQAPRCAPWRGLYRGGGGVRLRQGGPLVRMFDEPGSERRFEVLESRDDAARIVFSHGGVTLLAWVDLADFVPQPQRDLVLASGPGRVPPEGVGRVEIAPGEQVEVLRTKGDWHEVKLVRRSIRGWLPVAAFAPVFPVGGFPLTGDHGVARPRTRVLDRPGGKEIWRLPAEPDVHVDVGRETKGHLEIVLVRPCDATLRVTGFVRKRDVERFDGGHHGIGCATISIGEARSNADDTIAVTLPDGTELFDDQGRLVGRAREGNRLRRTKAGTLQVPSRWGPIPVVAEVEATPVAEE